MGPTASGKTDLAVRLVQNLPCEIISVDSALVYRGMDIGTAKPDADTLALAPHCLIDICDPAQAYSAARFRADALNAMQEISSRGQIPLLVGGTMLYFKVLVEGIADLPSADEEVRQRIRKEAQLMGWEALHARLARIDPLAAQKIHPNNPQRLLRALEVYEITGIPLGVHWQKNSAQTALPYQISHFAMDSGDRSELHVRINRRFEQMLEQGFVEEVAGLRGRGDLNPLMPSMKAVGYRQVWDYLEGITSYDEMVQRGMAATRQLAKRQLTWLRGWTDLQWLDSGVTNLSAMALKKRLANAI